MKFILILRWQGGHDYLCVMLAPLAALSQPKNTMHDLKFEDDPQHIIRMSLKS